MYYKQYYNTLEGVFLLLHKYLNTSSTTVLYITHPQGHNAEMWIYISQERL